MLTLRLCPTVTVGFVWLKEIAEVLVLPMVTLIIPQELISLEQTVMDAEPVVLAVVKLMTELAMLVLTVPPFWLVLLKTE